MEKHQSPGVSKKEPVVALSSCEDEYNISTSMCACRAVWLKTWWSNYAAKSMKLWH